MANAAMDISSTSEGGSAVGTSSLIGREMDKENRKRSSLQVGPSIPVEANTPTKDKIKATRKGRKVTFAKSIEEIPSPSWQAQPSHPGYSQDKRTEEPYAPKSHDRSPVRVPAAPFNHGSLYPSYIPLSPASRNDESIGASTSALPFSYPITDTLMQTQSQQHHLLTQHSPVHAPAPAPAPAGYFTLYQDYQPAPQTYASRSHPYTGPLYSVYNSQQPPHAAPVPNELHQGRGVASQRQTGQIATPFPPMAPYHAPYVQPPSRKVDSFVANDPWRPNIHRKHQKDVETFDEVPLPSASQPPWMPHGYQPRMASPQVPHPVSAVTPPAYQPPTVAFRDVPFVNPNPVVTPELPPSNGSSPRRRTSPAVPGSAAPLEPLRDPHPPRESEGSASPPHSFTSPSSGRRRSHSRSPDGSLRSEGLERETSSPVADPVSFPGHDGKNDSVPQPDMPPASPITSEWPTKHSNTSWSTESIGYPSYNPTTPPIPTKTLLRRLANIFKKALTFAVAFQFILATLLSQVYLSILLRLPSLYFSRVARIFEEADLTLPELKKMALETASQARGQVDLHAFQSESNKVPQYDRLRSTWESFIDSIMREWKTFNIISVLLLSAILTILQIESAADDPVTRYAALLSMICALVSLLFGCMYIIRFGSMRKTYKAAEWALEAKKTKTSMLWNVWVMLAMPAIWLTWSIILYFACIMSFIWRTSPRDANPPDPLSLTILLVIRTVISSILGLGLLYGTLILTTFRRYGEMMDRAWKRRIDGWIEEKNRSAYAPLSPYGPAASSPIPPVSNPQYQGVDSFPQNQYSPFIPYLSTHGGSPYQGVGSSSQNRYPFIPPLSTPESLYQGSMSPFIPPVPTSPYRYRNPYAPSLSTTPVIPLSSGPIDESRPPSSDPWFETTYANPQPVKPTNWSPVLRTPKTPESVLSTLNLDWEDIKRANTRRHSTDSYSIRSNEGNEGSSTSDVPAAVVVSSSRSQGRSSTLATLPTTYLPPIPWTPASESVASYDRTPQKHPSESVSPSRVEERQEYGHKKGNEGLLGATSTDSPPKYVLFRPRHPLPISDDESSLSDLDSLKGGPSLAMTDTEGSQRIEEDSFSQNVGRLNSTT